MALGSGSCLGAYEITAVIGVGGMGEVYRARDTTLGRDVAIKVLPASFTGDTSRVARFEHEAKTLASLSHSNIGHIYGLERSGGTTGLVMELVEGATLAERLAQGRIPVDEALKIAMQLASELAGVPRRFHKPSNLHSRRLSAGDIVFEVSGGSKGQPVGRTLLITAELLSAFDGDVICASFCKRIRPDITGYGSELLYLSFLEGYESGCAFRPMTDRIPNRWRTPFRRHGGQCSDGMADTLAAGSECCPP